jgi:hypothetical protein
MDRPPLRRLNLADLAILVAATSVGVWIMRSAQESRSRSVWTVSGPTSWSWKIGLEVSPFLLTTSAALIVAGSLPPRLGTRISLRQPGLLACLAILVGTAAGVSLRAGHRAVAGLRGFGLIDFFDIYLATVMGTGELVAASWATLALAGAWRSVPDWVDRSGRILGIFAILLWVASGLSL